MILGRSKVITALLSWTVSISICAAIFYHLRNDYQKLLQILSIDPLHLVLLSVLFASLFLPPSMIRKLMAGRLGIRLTFGDMYGLLMVTNMLSLVLPARGDLAVTALYLRKKYNLPITHFVSMLYGSAVLLAICLSFTGVICLVLVVTEGVVLDAYVVGIILTFGTISLLLGWLPSGFLQGESMAMKRLRAAMESWERLRSDSVLLVKVTILIMAGIALFCIWMYLSYRILGFEVRFLPTAVASVVVSISFFAAITPGNLGIREALLGFISQLLGLGFTEGVAVTLLQRAVSILVFLVFGGFYSFFIIGAFVTPENGEKRKESGNHGLSSGGDDGRGDSSVSDPKTPI